MKIGDKVYIVNSADSKFGERGEIIEIIKDGIYKNMIRVKFKIGESAIYYKSSLTLAGD